VISILLPNLNNREFLEERIESIYRQTISDWELIVVDGYSDDGAWEFFKDLASKDSRVKISQAPRQGIYAGWNECVRLATARYVYFATSDDIMAADCLEKLAAALDRHLDCGIAHCDLKLFDEHSNEISKDWWWNHLFVQSSEGYVHRRHVRKAPFDGLLHLFGETVYTSITQMMIRRSLFDRTGLFPTNRGRFGDYQWVMKATLITDTVYLPDTWGGWRKHSNQATLPADKASPDHWRAFESMSQCVLDEVKAILAEPVRRFISKPAAMSSLRKNRIQAELNLKRNPCQRIQYIVREFWRYPSTLSSLVLEKIMAKVGLKRNWDPRDWVDFLKNCGLEPELILIDD
jgi:hypothetical protein